MGPAVNKSSASPFASPALRKCYLSFFQTERAYNLLFYYFVWHHFTADLGETGEPAFDVEKPVFVQPADVAVFNRRYVETSAVRFGSFR